jgi:hypothetical protein
MLYSDAKPSGRRSRRDGIGDDLAAAMSLA